MTPLLDLADAQFAQLVAVSARLPFEQHAAFVQVLRRRWALARPLSWVRPNFKLTPPTNQSAQPRRIC